MLSVRISSKVRGCTWDRSGILPDQGRRCPAKLGQTAIGRVRVRSLPRCHKSYKEAHEFVAELQQLVNSLKTTSVAHSLPFSCSSADGCHASSHRSACRDQERPETQQHGLSATRFFSSYYLDTLSWKKGNETAKGKESNKTRVLVGGANREDVECCRDALISAKIKPEAIGVGGCVRHQRLPSEPPRRRGPGRGARGHRSAHDKHQLPARRNAADHAHHATLAARSSTITSARSSC